MKNLFSILCAVVLVVVLTFGACQVTPPEPYVQWNPDIHGEVSFSQLEWMASPHEALYPYSNVGEVEFTFLEGAGDWLLDEVGGGWLNVVIDTTAHNGSEQWAVRNLYLTYENLDFLLGSSPSVQFSLGLDGKTPIEWLEAAVFLSHEPLEEQPEAEELATSMVSLMTYLVGGVDGGGSATWDTPLTIGAFNGSSAKVVRSESIRIPVDDVVAINESHMGCAPGSAARSICYLSDVHNFTPDDPQDIYDDLVVEMKTQICHSGTTCGNFTQGKDSYCTKKGLNITTQFVLAPGWAHPSGRTAASWNDLMKEVMDALKNKCDVEVLMYSCVWNGSAWNITGGHMAMVTWGTSNQDGSAVIGVVDDPDQRNGRAENRLWSIQADNTGKFQDGTNRRVAGFMIQCITGT